ncbi:hypothetical protein [Anaeromyxobacter paludicola]|uniref:Uncharacterized protein n=1 Tax=Anaeromyxobacter paludicola TaxID=2918171 RepID=A0ABM7XAC8_9BACT|nr:hypothetical protein [Anaeromyxobacter paludicola]BDG08778.1 hypothetical protein AMPC_18910 [Anaeromyxobacter paludicola]
MGYTIRPPMPGVNGETSSASAEARRAQMTLIQGEGRKRRPAPGDAPVDTVAQLPILRRDEPAAQQAVRVLWGGDQAAPQAERVKALLAAEPQAISGLHQLSPEVAAKLLGD